MSTWQREAAEKLRRKYASVHQVPIEAVTVRMMEDDDVEVSAKGLPTWTLGTSGPRWATDHRVKTL